ncbi:MAG TPA: hypothetical protein VF398_11060 [bacterium]|jgi:hypothetical protein
MTLKSTILSVFYVSTGIATVLLLVYGGNYYLKPLVDRPHHQLHDAIKPGGFWGHGLGIIGTVLMLLMLLYMARKYLHFMRKWGNIGIWLDIHIWLGITGSILITFHTAFKFGGIVSISFWSMVAVAASGVFGRYIYLQIPRRLSGDELTPEELRERNRTLTEQIASLPSVAEPLLTSIQSIAKFTERPTAGGASGIRDWMTDSWRLRFQLLALRRELRTKTKLNRYLISDLIRAIKEQRLLNRRMMFLKAAHRILHHWHLIHRPFALVMYVIMGIHVLVTTLLGYTWIF